MSPSRMVVPSVMLAGWALFVVSGRVAAQSNSDPTTPTLSAAQIQAKQEALRRGRLPYTIPRQIPSARSESRKWTPERGTSVATRVKPVSNVTQPATLPVPDEPSPDNISASAGSAALQPPQLDDEFFGPELSYDGYDEVCGCGGGCGHGCSDGCCSLGGCSDHGCSVGCAFFGHWSHCPPWWIRNFSFFAGVHGFKGPADQGRNGNFGFHEGFNWGAPLGGPFCIGYQLGMQAVHSNFAGDQTTSDSYFRESGRDQIFFTAGLFRRAMCSGWQSGIAFDLLHDSYYGTADLTQIRTESALVFSGCREIGFWGNFGVGCDDFSYERLEQVFTQPMGPTDTYSLFFRRHFSGGGQGRLWAGFSGNGDGVLGGDCTVPLGTSWALENNFTYLIPKAGDGADGQQDETWSVSIQLVWYPGREARCVFRNPYQPLFSVADNSLFILEQR